jgi:hypothetical protein
MKEIIEINKRIMIEASDVIPKGDDCLFVSRDGNGDKAVNQLPAKLKADLDVVCAKLNEVIPNDFNYVLCFGNYNSQIILEFCDGGMARANCAESFNPQLSIFKQLQKVNWAKHRTFGMAGSQFFDGMAALSGEIEPDLPPTAEIQKNYGVELEAFSKTKRQGQAKIHLLKWREDEGVTENSCASMKDLRGDLCDLMTCRYDILGVIVDKNLLPPRKVDKLKREVLKGMKESMPISYARALRVF